MYHEFNEDNTIITITETIKDVGPGYILGIDPEEDGLDRFLCNGGGGQWIIRAIPALIERLIRKGWSIHLTTKSDSIIYNADDVRYLGYRNSITLNKDMEPKIVRWHGDILIMDFKYDRRVIIPYSDLETFTAKISSGSKLLEKYSPAAMIVTKSGEDRYEIKIKATDTRWLTGVVEKYQLKHYPLIQSGNLLTPGTSPGQHGILGMVVVDTPQALEWAMICLGIRIKADAFNEREVKGALDLIAAGEKLLLRDSTSLSFYHLSELSNSLNFYNKSNEPTEQEAS